MHEKMMKLKDVPFEFFKGKVKFCQKGLCDLAIEGNTELRLQSCERWMRC